MTGSLQTDYGAQGTAAARPAVPDAHSSTLSFYFATDTEVLSFYDWNDGAWQDVTAPTAASTTEVLTGTDTAKMVTADALAALWEKGSDEASGATVSLGEGKFFHITGTTTITDIDFDTDKAGREAILTFEGILTLTHNATSLILPTGANITTAAGDCCCVISEGSDNVRVVWYQRKDGTPLAGGGGGGGNTYFGLALTTPPTVGSLTWVNQSTATDRTTVPAPFSCARRRQVVVSLVL